jgi:hypothetical protein
MSYSYEEIRVAALDLITGREKAQYPIDQFQHLVLGVGVVLAKRDGKQPGALNKQEKETLLELFWDLFRQGIITLGIDDNNRQFPFFRLTRSGQQIASGVNSYFFHDDSSYEAAIRLAVPGINEATLVYLREAMQSFRSGCLLSATVMLGVASEHTFALLMEKLNSNDDHKQTFANVFTERTLLQKFNKFRNILDGNLRSLPADVREDLDTHLSGILSVLRNFRNDAGHPTGFVPQREQTFVLLQLIIPYLKKQYQLINHFSKPA